MRINHRSHTESEPFLKELYNNKRYEGLFSEKLDTREYTLIFPILEGFDKVLLLHINKPTSKYHDHLNGFGGKIDTGESVVLAALRELEEESSLTPKHLKKFERITTEVHRDGAIVHVFYAIVNASAFSSVKSDDREGSIHWVSISEICSTKQPLAGFGNIPYFLQYARYIDDNLT